MMRRYAAFYFASICCLAGAAMEGELLAQDPAVPAPAVPAPAFSGPPPRPAEVQLVRDVLIVERPMIQMVLEERTRTALVDGKEVAQSYTVMRPMIVGSDQFALPADDYRIYALDGKQLEAAEAARQLETTKVVLLSESSRLVDPQYLKLYRDDMLVVYIRPQPPRYIPPPPAMEVAPQPAIQPPPAPVPVP